MAIFSTFSNEYPLSFPSPYFVDLKILKSRKALTFEFATGIPRNCDQFPCYRTVYLHLKSQFYQKSFFIIYPKLGPNYRKTAASITKDKWLRGY